MGGFNNGGNAVQLQGYPIAVTGPTNNQVLTWNGSAWTPTSPSAGGVTSFNTRTGAVVPANADYLAVASGGLTGAVQATRYVGGTTNGAPTTGTFAVGDFIIDATASIWICTTAGTPGTWCTTISNHMTLRSATATAKYNEITLFTGSTAAQTISAPASPLDSTTFTIINNSSVPVTAGFSANAMYPLGSASTVTSLAVPVNSAYTFVNYNGGNWYMTASNNLSNQVGSLPTNTVLTSPIENAYVSSGLTGATNVYVTTNSTNILYTSAAGNFTVNFASTSSVSLNTLLGIGQSVTTTIQIVQGATAYYMNAASGNISIDGTAVTTKWQGGTAPTAGNANEIDVYSFVITKTASATYTVLAALTKF